MTTFAQEISPFPDRAQALYDGDLIDVSATALSENLQYPTAISRRAYQELVRDHCRHEGGDEYTRLHQVMSQLRAAYAVKRFELPLVRTVVPSADLPGHYWYAEVWMLLEVNDIGERRWTVFMREEA